MKIASKIKKLFRVQYRLSVMYRGDVNFTNIYGNKGRLLRKMAKRMNADCWTLYKRGPLFLSEREVDRGEWKGGSK